MAKLLRVDRKATMTQATTCYRQEQQKTTKDTAPGLGDVFMGNSKISMGSGETGHLYHG